MQQQRFPRILAVRFKLSVLAVLLTPPVVGAWQLLTLGVPWVMPVYLLTSLLAVLLFWIDKRNAREDRRRIPEHTLHTVELFGGWPGTLIAQQLFRHKTRKTRYLVTLWAIMGLHQLVWLDGLVLDGRLLWDWLAPLLG